VCGANRWLPSMPDESQRLAHRAVQRLLAEMAHSYTSRPPRGRTSPGTGVVRFHTGSAAAPIRS